MCVSAESAKFRQFGNLRVLAAKSLPLPALGSKEFRNYLGGSFVSNIGNTVQTWAIFWHLFHITNDSFMVGLGGLVRIGPLLFLSLFGGVVADQFDRRKVLLLTQSGMAAVSLLLFVLTAQGYASVGLLYSIVALNAIARAFDGPARQSMLPSLVRIEHLRNALSINGMAWRLSDVLGPVIAGMFIGLNESKRFGQLVAGFGIPHQPGLSLCYLANFLSFFAVLLAVWFLKPKKVENAGDRPKSFREVLWLIGEGLTFVNRTPVVRSAMWIDFWATLLSGAEALLPAFASAKVLGLDPAGYGKLAAASAAGALIAAVLMSFAPQIHRQGRTVVFMIGLYGLFTVFFGLAPNLEVACLSLACVGAADMVSTVLRQTIRQLATPDELRGRMSATSSLFHISGPQLGDFEAGLVARLFGERISVVLGGGLCMLVAAHFSRAKALVEYTSDSAERDAKSNAAR